jgi:uncharacterized protein
MSKKTIFRFYEELNDFLPSERKKVPFIFEFTGNPSVKDSIEALGVPHTEVDLILSNGVSVSFSYHLQDGDMISVYPVFESIDISQVIRLREKPLREPKFIVDAHLGKLAKYLRLLGFDCCYKKNYTDSEITVIAENLKLIILTRKVSLLKSKTVNRGYWIRSQHPVEQAREVVSRFDLSDGIKPFSRCMVCNGTVSVIDKSSIINELELKTSLFYQDFYRCTSCMRIYWKGSHFIKLQNLIQSIIGKNTKERR